MPVMPIACPSRGWPSGHVGGGFEGSETDMEGPQVVFQHLEELCSIWNSEKKQILAV